MCVHVCVWQQPFRRPLLKYVWKGTETWIHKALPWNMWPSALHRELFLLWVGYKPIASFVILKKLYIQ